MVEPVANFGFADPDEGRDTTRISFAVYFILNDLISTCQLSSVLSLCLPSGVPISSVAEAEVLPSLLHDASASARS